METIYKTPQKNTYLKGNFSLRDENSNWAHPIDFPTVFVAYGKGIKSGGWRSCTSINTPMYVINNYFNGRKSGLINLWEYCSELEKITWKDVKENKSNVLTLINLANNELLKLQTI